ncbi:hypothetical protein, partial [Klebsiella pneumoniae]|uniref:hypothetical protein n=1 Tax=Klebsiella pneumoniae TaxID=573 RepID=UPI0027318E64
MVDLMLSKSLELQLNPQNINVGTIGHIDHGRTCISTLVNIYLEKLRDKELECNSEVVKQRRAHCSN